MAPPDEDAAILEALGPHLCDPVWRLHNLYWIKDAKGKAIKFSPKSEQIELIDAIYKHGMKKILIPKARQLGISTVIALIMLDMMLFGGGIQAALVDQTQADASKKLRGKIHYAFSKLPRALREQYEVLKANDHTLSIKLAGKDDDTASEVQAGMNARGDTFQILHISEWGPIAFKDPPRSEEIMTGAIPAAKQGIVVVETTWEAEVGHLWDITKRALEIPPEHRTEEDFTVFFFPWWGDPEYVLAGDARQIPEDCAKYLREAEEEIGKEGQKSEVKGQKSAAFRFSDAQKLWYFKKAWILGLFRFQEYPSMLSECFRAPIEGAIYGALLDKVRARGGMSGIKPDPVALVNTSWDLGSPINTVVWYWQVIADEFRFLDCDVDLDLTPAERVHHMREKGYNYGYHYLPHDAEAKKDQGRTFQAELEDEGLTNTRVVPRTEDVWIGINRVRKMMPRMNFRTPACEEALNRLEAYRSGVWIDKGRAMDMPVHDKSSHVADGLRMVAEADLAGMLDSGWVKSSFSSEGLKALSGAAS